MNSKWSSKQHHPAKTNEGNRHEIPLAERQDGPVALHISLDTRTNKLSKLLDKVPHCSVPQKE